MTALTSSPSTAGPPPARRGPRTINDLAPERPQTVALQLRHTARPEKNRKNDQTIKPARP